MLIYFTSEFDIFKSDDSDLLRNVRYQLDSDYIFDHISNGDRLLTSVLKEDLKKIKKGNKSFAGKLCGKVLKKKLDSESAVFTEEELAFLRRTFCPKQKRTFPEFYSTLNQLGFFGVNTFDDPDDNTQEFINLFKRLNKPDVSTGSLISMMDKAEKEVADFVEKLLRQDHIELPAATGFKKHLADNPEFKKHFIPKSNCIPK